MMTGIAVVTGGTRGIGGAVANRLREQGREVVTVARTGATVNADLATTTGRFDAHEAIIDSIGDGGQIQTLVLAAGGYFADSPSDMISVNHFGAAALLASLQPALATGSSTTVIGSASTTFVPDVPMGVVEACLAGDEDRARGLIATSTGMVAARAYVASKLSLAYLVRQTAPTPGWAGPGRRLNYLALGPVATGMLDALERDVEVGELVRSLVPPTGSVMTPAEAADVVMLLDSPAARNIVGATVFADGGLDAQFRPRDWPGPMSTRD